MLPKEKKTRKADPPIGSTFVFKVAQGSWREGKIDEKTNRAHKLVSAACQGIGQKLKP